MMTGISSVRSWVIVLCSLMPRAYLNSYFLAKIHANCELPILQAPTNGCSTMPCKVIRRSLRARIGSTKPGRLSTL
jgi:hypothetical protein